MPRHPCHHGPAVRFVIETAGVTVSARTDSGWVTNGVHQAVDERALLIHIAQPEEAAKVITYLVSDYANLITANTIYLR